ncbi:MAG: extracellular solute-binding protein [Actinobacteria bacterium]|nr:extracellular solute-binding protein [Actinomycetota bacterium]
MSGMVIRLRSRFVASVAAGILVLAGSLTAMRVLGSYHPVFRSCAASADLVVAGGIDNSINRQRDQLISQWNAGARGHDPRARFVEISDNADLAHNQLMAAERSGSCGYDVLLLDVIWTAEFARDGLIRKIPSRDISNRIGFIPAVLQTGQWNGQQYAVPFDSNVGLLYYRKDRTGPPPTWDGLVNRGYAGQLRDYEGLTVNALEAIWNDRDPNVLAGTSTHITPETVKTKVLPTLGRLASAVRKGGPLRASRAFDETASQNAFADRRAGLMRNWPDAYRPLAADPRQWTGSNLAFAVEPLPGGHGALGGEDLAVATASRHPMKQVLDLINFLTSGPSEDKLFACAGIPPTRWVALTSAARCPQNSHHATPDTGRGHALGSAQISQFISQLSRALNDAVRRPVTPYYTAFSVTFRSCVEKVLDGDPPAPQDFADAVNAALAGRGTYPSCHT